MVKSYVEFENGQRVDVFARKFENEFQFRIETNQSDLQQKIENEVDKIKEGLQNKFETDINFFWKKIMNPNRMKVIGRQRKN